jgi:hypothetical protein
MKIFANQASQFENKEIFRKLSRKSEIKVVGISASDAAKRIQKRRMFRGRAGWFSRPVSQQRATRIQKRESKQTGQMHTIRKNLKHFSF